ncbi:unnamed protein product [Heligmosomoides polygyrus]|uniref:E3 ubiquitin-protein ligase SHPRH n=1 Tax=Heligmosomoides polygyrus TaxID=6339 RepID=A0A183FM52_HELPZ|nr:unnamed protein product [Heligmosomoides polygyrus]
MGIYKCSTPVIDRYKVHEAALSADARVVIHLLTLKCFPPLDKEPSREEIKRMASILKDFEARLKDFEARQLEVDEDEQLEVVEEEEEYWNPQDELMMVESHASSGHMITFAGGTLVSDEKVRLQLGFRCVLITEKSFRRSRLLPYHNDSNCALLL